MHIFLYTLIFVHEIYAVIGFFVFRPLKIKDFSKQVWLVGFSLESLQAAFFMP